MTKLAIAFILGSFAVWQFTGLTNAKQIFFFSLLGAMTTFAVKFIQHRRMWSELVSSLPNEFGLIVARTSTLVFLGSFKNFRRGGDEDGWEVF
jgi:hypothetical protein